jgi:hypothetical protein
VSYDDEKAQRIKLMLKRKVNIDFQDKNGDGANLMLTNKNGKAAFEIAPSNSQL